MSLDDAAPCAECGACGCQAAFDRAMALEFTDPTYGAVHHLTVSAFMVQHPSRLSAHGWAQEVYLLAAFLAGLTPAQARRRPPTESGLSLTRGEPATGAWTWSGTIVDVGFEHPDRYRHDVRAWAASVSAAVATVSSEEEHR